MATQAQEVTTSPLQRHRRTHKLETGKARNPSSRDPSPNFCPAPPLQRQKSPLDSAESGTDGGREGSPDDALSRSLPPVRSTVVPVQWSRDLREAKRAMPKLEGAGPKPAMPVLPPAADCIGHVNRTRSFKRSTIKAKRTQSFTRRTLAPAPPQQAPPRAPRPPVPSRHTLRETGSRVNPRGGAGVPPNKTQKAWVTDGAHSDADAGSEISDSEAARLRNRHGRRRSLSDSELDVAPIAQWKLDQDFCHTQTASEIDSVSSQSDNESLASVSSLASGRSLQRGSAGQDAGSGVAQMDEVEEEEDSPEASAVRVNSIRESEADGSKLSLWDEWRIHFPLQALDTLTQAFTEMEGSGSRELSLDRLQQLSTSVCVPFDAVKHEMLAKQQPHRREKSIWHVNVEDTELPSGMSFLSLQEFLDFFLVAALRAEIECGELMWKPEELTMMKEAYAKCADIGHQLPSLRVFDVFRLLPFLEIDASQVEQQHKIIDAMRCVLGEKVNRAVSRPGSGKLSQEELIRVVTRAERWWRRHLRRADMRREREVQQQADFTAAEVEDLRELHMTYSYLQSETTNKDPVCAMKALLGRCGVPTLSEAEVNALCKVLESKRGTAVKEHKTSRAKETVSFSIFMEWMSQVFQQELGGLRSGGIPATPKAATGFLSAFLRADRKEREKAMFRMDAADDWYLGGNSLPGSQRGSHRDSNCSAIQLEMPEDRAARSNRRQRTVPSMAGAGWSSRMRSRRNSNSSVKRSATSSRIASGNSSCRSSRRASGRQAEGEAAGDDHGHLVLKGLPTPESMLGHKMIRACSVDLTGKDTEGNAGPASQAAPAGLAPAALAGDLSAAMKKLDSGSQSGRKAKEAQDTGILVMEAMTRLQWHESPVESPDPV